MRPDGWFPPNWSTFPKLKCCACGDTTLNDSTIKHRSNCDAVFCDICYAEHIDAVNYQYNNSMQNAGHYYDFPGDED